MAKDSSFDVVSEFDKQELLNAVDQTMRDINSRFDLKNTNSDIALEADKCITITTSDDMKLRNIYGQILVIDIICIVYIVDMIYYQLFHIKRQFVHLAHLS